MINIIYGKYNIYSIKIILNFIYQFEIINDK